MFPWKVGLHSKAQLLALIPTQLTELLDLIMAQTSLALRKLFRGWRGVCPGALRNRQHAGGGAAVTNGLRRGGLRHRRGRAARSFPEILKADARLGTVALDEIHANLWIHIRRRAV
ncbi:hypothetical protein GCM10007857_76840 [Bradyrhizobium iriomotense]|uniref:Uncharacterized protein n=1 Tax=Bradyrhizobium iriomotense TaxID=441950 RepID=A0ABQ6BFM3_9BRAD|nr:hypothetical protein GCM10007857_76840 [Bradyrhizobium iriomotense]